MQPSIFYFLNRPLKYNSQAAPPLTNESLGFWQIPKSLLTAQTKLFFLLLNISYKWHSTLLLSLLTAELVPPQPRDQALHTHELHALFCVLLLSCFFSPFWKRKHADYTAFQKGKQLLQIPEQSSLLKLKSWVFSHGKKEAGKGKSCGFAGWKGFSLLVCSVEFKVQRQLVQTRSPSIPSVLTGC